MAEWQGRERVYVGDAFGNSRTLQVGLVRVGKRTTIGLQDDGEHQQDRPDFTMDVEAVTDLIQKLKKHRSALMKVNPMGRPS